MTQKLSRTFLPLSDDQKLAIYRQARRAQAEAFVAAGAAVITALRRLFAIRPISSRATGRAA